MRFAGEHPESSRAASVPVDRSKNQIEGLLSKHGAEGFHTGWQSARGDDPGWDAIEFVWKQRVIRFRLERPKRASSQAALEQRHRQRWRVLFLVIKAKLEAVVGLPLTSVRN